MNIGNKLSIVFTSVSMLAICICLLITKEEDKVPPVITFRSNRLIYSEHTDKNKLMESVSVVDDRDGDVTDTIVIEKITKTSDGKAVIVTYAARDYSNNFVKSSRIFEVAPVEIKEIEKNEETTEQATKTQEESEEVKKDSSEEDSTVKKAVDNLQAEEKKPENSVAKKDTQVNTTPVLQLNTTETTLHKGNVFNINDYIAQLSDSSDTLEMLQHKIQTNGEFDNNTVGDYLVTVLVTNSKGNQSEAQQLTIHVIE